MKITICVEPQQLAAQGLDDVEALYVTDEVWQAIAAASAGDPAPR